MLIVFFELGVHCTLETFVFILFIFCHDAIGDVPTDEHIKMSFIKPVVWTSPGTFLCWSCDANSQIRAHQNTEH